MNWNSVGEFAAMGGYGLYVWGAFGATALVIAAELLSLRARRRALLALGAQTNDRATAHVAHVTHVAHVSYGGAAHEG